MIDCIKLFVGCAPNGEDAESQMVLEHTVKKNSSMPVDIVWMHMTASRNTFWDGWTTKQWSTPFSGFRWGIPEYCNFSGQAIYSDSDVMFLGDLAELWRLQLNGEACIAAKSSDRFCVMKWDCHRASGLMPPMQYIREDQWSHHLLTRHFSSSRHLVQTFDRLWNNFDGENDGLHTIKALHYTDMSTQPHLPYAVDRLDRAGRRHWYDGPRRQHRRKDVVELFDYWYERARDEGYDPEAYVPHDGYVEYQKLSQTGYSAANGFDVTRGE